MSEEMQTTVFVILSAVLVAAVYWKSVREMD